MKDISRLTLEEKVGQLFFLGFQGSAPDSETQALLDGIRPGGFLFFQRNIESINQFFGLTTRLREINGLPLFLALEHEGGRVDRLKQVFSPLPSMTELASLGTAFVRAGAKIIAAELEAAGLNLNFAPVLDLSTSGSVMSERTLSSNPLEVTRLGGAFVEELARKNVLSCVKHFPGLGAARSDPHFLLPRIDKTKRQLVQEDVLPFMNLIDEVPMMMISHAHYPGLGDEKPTPASLSSRVIEGFLRKKMGYTGVVITDDLTVGAISSIGLNPETFLRAFEAGNDLLLFSQTTPLVEQAFKTIVKAARTSESLRARLNESVSRILALKGRIQYTPVRYRAHVRNRINRQIEKLRAESVLSPRSAHTTV
jgi:beta-N-acetylhexosaminidase